MTNEIEEAIEALEELKTCMEDITTMAYKCGVTELAKFKSKEQFEKIRNALTQRKTVDVAKLKADTLKQINLKQVPEFIVADTVNYLAANGYLTPPDTISVKREVIEELLEYRKYVSIIPDTRLRELILEVIETALLAQENDDA